MKKLLYIIFFLATIGNAQQLAFPTAMGAGAYSTGGRGGEVIHVTNLNDSGTGSLRWALTDASNRGNSRTIIFDVSGIINLSSDILIDDTGGQGYADGITIAGQTAPEGNITITGGKLKFYRIDDVIVRYLKFRSTTNVNGALLVSDCNQTVLDHLTGSHTEGGEVAFGITDNSLNDNADTTNRTFQYNLVHDNGLGLILGDTSPSSNNYSPSYSVIRNAFINISHRAPGKVGGALRLDVVNNLVHNHNDRLLRIDDWDYTLNYVGNYHSKGGQTVVLANTAYFGTNNGKIYDNDNYYDPDFNVGNWIDFDQPREDPVPASSFVQTAFTYNNASTFNIISKDSLKTKVLPFIGCYKYINDSGQVVEDRDNLDSTAINQAITESTSEFSDYEITLGEIPTANNTRPVNFYGTNSHIPSAWLSSNGYSNTANIHNQVEPDGYTVLEHYINQVDEDVPVINIPQITRTDANPTSIVQGGTYTPPTGTWTDVEDGSGTATVGGDLSFVEDGLGENLADQYTIIQNAGTSTLTFSDTDTINATGNGDGTVIRPIIRWENLFTIGKQYEIEINHIVNSGSLLWSFYNGSNYNYQSSNSLSEIFTVTYTANVFDEMFLAYESDVNTFDVTTTISIREVIPNSKVKDNALGTYNVTLSHTDTDGNTGSITIPYTITASTINVTSVTVSPSTASININATTNLTETIAPVNATNQTGVWSSSNGSVATVNQSGVVTGVSEGSSTITFTTNDGTFTDTCIVTVNAVVQVGGNGGTSKSKKIILINN